MAAINRAQQMALEQEDESELEFHGDVLEAILSHVPLVDLVSASHVSKSWRAAVSSSLRHHNKPQPWLILHTQGTRSPYASATHAYDPRSDVWIKISRPPIECISGGIKSSHSNFLYMLSPSHFSFSLDALNFKWYHVEPPLVWRRDPIVARVGNVVVVAGGGCDFGDDPLAVEIYDLSTCQWHSCDSMPGSLRDTLASNFLSVAVTAEKLVVTDKESGETYWFDPETKFWSEPFSFRIHQSVNNYNIGWTNNSLILVGLCKIGNVEKVKVWRAEGEDFECEEIGEMPLAYVEKLRSEGFGKCSINIRVAGNIVYVYNNNVREVEEVVACELMANGGCRWWSVRNVVAHERVEDRLVFTCAEVGIDELQRIMKAGNGRFEIVDA